MKESKKSRWKQADLSEAAAEMRPSEAGGDEPGAFLVIEPLGVKELRHRIYEDEIENDADPIDVAEALASNESAWSGIESLGLELIEEPEEEDHDLDRDSSEMIADARREVRIALRAEILNRLGRCETELRSYAEDPVFVIQADRMAGKGKYTEALKDRIVKLERELEKLDPGFRDTSPKVNAPGAAKNSDRVFNVNRRQPCV